MEISPAQQGLWGISAGCLSRSRLSFKRAFSTSSRSFSEVPRGVANSVEAFRFQFPPHDFQALLPECGRGGLGKQSCLFDEVDDSQANELQFVHGSLDWLTIHETHDPAEESNRPGFRLLRVFLWGRDERFRVVFQFLVTMRTRVRVKEIAEFNTTMRAFRFTHVVLSFSFPGTSVIRHSVVSSKPAIDAAFCMAARVTFLGSTTPALTKSSYSLVATL